MPQLTPEGHRIAADLASRHGFSVDAVEQMLISMVNGNGTMAQFSHADFGGYGQWMRGGMLMLGDMFNHGLKGRVDALCNDIAQILQSHPHLVRTGSFQSQSQSSGSDTQSQRSGAHPGSSSLFQPDPVQNWWPSNLGSPNATGAQNNVRYAYFADARRLAVDVGGDVWVYDTQNHHIGGFSQQQGSGGSILFNSQWGPVTLSALPVVSRNGRPVESQPAAQAQPYATNSALPSNHGSESDVFAALEKLGDLKAKGILTDEEFTRKKAELLSRL